MKDLLDITIDAELTGCIVEDEPEGLSRSDIEYLMLLTGCSEHYVRSSYEA